MTARDPTRITRANGVGRLGAVVDQLGVGGRLDGQVADRIPDREVSKESGTNALALPEFESVATPAAHVSRFRELEGFPVFHTHDEKTPTALRYAVVRREQNFAGHGVPEFLEGRENLLAHLSVLPVHEARDVL